MIATGASVRDALAAATDAIAASGSGTPRLDAEVLLEHAAGLGRAQLAAAPELELPPAAARLFAAFVRRRVALEPVAYITGRKGFRGIELEVDCRVLVPRPETELLVELAVELAPRTVLDVGTGSGAVALAVADELPGATVTATDTSAAALEVAAANAARLGLSARVRVLEGSVPADRFDLVLANLPYVAEAGPHALEPGVARHEPAEALFAGPDGLGVIRAVLAAMSGNLPGCLGLEVGAGQAAEVERLVRQAGFARTEIRPDLAGHDRVVVGWE